MENGNWSQERQNSTTHIFLQLAINTVNKPIQFRSFSFTSVLLRICVTKPVLKPVVVVLIVVVQGHIVVEDNRIVLGRVVARLNIVGLLFPFRLTSWKLLANCFAPFHIGSDLSILVILIIAKIIFYPQNRKDLESITRIIHHIN